MKLWHRPTPTPTPRANPTRIAVLEHDLLGIQPEPGSAAALTIALRRAGTCMTHEPVDVTTWGDPQPVARCGRCGGRMALDDDGAWSLA